MQQLTQFLNHNWAMSTALVIIFFLILLNEIQFLRKKGKEVSPQNAVHLINHDNAIIIDLRDKENYLKNHIIDAINASAEDFKQKKMARYKDKTIILVCDKGLKSASLSTQLRDQGFNNLLVLSGGMQAWHSAQLPTIKGK